MRSIFLFTISLFLLFVGCKKEDSATNTSSSIVGTWKLTKLTVNGTAQPVNYVETVKLNSDNTYTYTRIENNQTYSDSGTYSTANGKVTVTHQDHQSQTMDYTLNGNTLIITETDNSVTPPEVWVSEYTRQ